MRLAAELVQGVDVWINTPRRPWEASGTSGMKVLVNGGLNLSTLDGWWSEAFDADSGWALGDRNEQNDDDAEEAAQLYALLEQEIVPEFYERDAEGLPRRWIARMRASMAALAPHFSSVRMLQEIRRDGVRARRSIVQTARSRSGRRRSDDRAVVATARTALGRHPVWRDHRNGGNGRFTLSVPVFLGEITPEDVHVELYANPENANDAFVQQMTPVEPIAGLANAFIYSTTVESVRPA